LGSPRRDRIRRIVETLYEELRHQYHIRYEYEEAFAEARGAQRIRPPQTVGEERRGTCLDLTLLFLSCLKSVQLWPVYVQVTFPEWDHAIGGTWLEPPDACDPSRLDATKLREYVKEGRILVLDATGFVVGYLPQEQKKLEFTEACKQAERLVRDEEIRFVLDIDRP
jgi:hypothetical protein